MLTGPSTQRRSNAKTAYGLMSDIKQYILEEPKRIFMGLWIMDTPEAIKRELGVQGPACGTVGCIAGNAMVLTRRPLTRIGLPARELLGGDNEDLQDSLYDLFHGYEVKANYGTKKYARIVAKRIEGFQHKHEAALRAVKIS